MWRAWPICARRDSTISLNSLSVGLTIDFNKVSTVIYLLIKLTCYHFLLTLGETLFVNSLLYSDIIFSQTKLIIAYSVPQNCLDPVFQFNFKFSKSARLLMLFFKNSFFQYYDIYIERERLIDQIGFLIGRLYNYFHVMFNGIQSSEKLLKVNRKLDRNQSVQGN